MAAIPEGNSQTSDASTFIKRATRSRIADFSCAPSVDKLRFVNVRSATRDETICPVCCQYARISSRAAELARTQKIDPSPSG